MNDLDDKAVDVGGIGNYYGGLYIAESDGKYYWSIENWDGHWWEEIAKPLYDELIKLKR